MELKLEVGKKYTDRTGNVRGPMRLIKNPAWHKFTDGKLSWGQYGAALSTGDEFDNDIIAIWQDATTGPVRTVTRKEIVPGVYGDVEVVEDETYQGGIGIYINATMNAARIRAAANNMLAVADAMEDN